MIRLPATALLLCLLCSACSTTEYYWQAVRGHLDLMSRRQPIDRVIADPATPDTLRSRLRTVQALRRFAVAQLGLPDNGSYRSYAALDRPYVLWNVFAADALSVRPREWCFPVAGCVAYHGYFARSDAEGEASRLRAAGDDVYLGGVPAYSTLGWMDDPVLSTFIQWPEVELARLLFHELAHQMAYAPGDTAFNEAFASTIEEEGVQRWIQSGTQQSLAQAWQAAQMHRSGFQALVLQARHDLEQLYGQALPREAKLARKALRLQQLAQDYAALKERWGGFAGYDRWFTAGVNNAQLASLAVYAEWVPAFRQLLADDGDDLPTFYAHMKRLAAERADQRLAVMQDARARSASGQTPGPSPAPASAATRG